MTFKELLLDEGHFIYGNIDNGREWIPQSLELVESGFDQIQNHVKKSLGAGLTYKGLTGNTGKKGWMFNAVMTIAVYEIAGNFKK